MTGIVLIVAAGLKFAGHSQELATGLIGSPAVQTAAIVWEFGLGFWLLSGVMKPLAWTLSIATFLAFCLLSLSAGIAGQASCGCLGAVHASPWILFCVDIAIIGLLTAGRARNVEWKKTAHSGLAQRAGLTLFVMAAVIFSAIIWTGSPDAALSRLRGERLVVTTPSLDLGAGLVGDRLEAVATARNYSSAAINIVGGATGCTCISTEGLPVTIPPNGQGNVSIILAIPSATPGRSNRVVVLYTDCPSRPQLRLRAGCRVDD